MLKAYLNSIYSWLLVFIVALGLLLAPNSAFAQQGCCSWHGGIAYCDSSVGTYVCNDGTYSPSCGCYRAPPPPPTFPKMNASWSFITNTDGTYNILATLDDSAPTRYSVTLNKSPGANPGPLVDYTNPSFAFNNVYPGTWYMNVMKDINNVWSTVSYWTISVPAWVEPTPTPTSIDTPTPVPNIDTSTNNKSFIGSFFDWLFGLFKSKDTSISDQSTESSSYTCDCSKTCTQISTCAEAYYQLDTCGCSVRDGDSDGVPCENLCN